MADRDVTVRLRADIGQYTRQLAAASAATSAFGKSADGSGKAIDRLSGRLRLAADAALVLGPALVPIGAAAVGGIVAMSAQLGALAGGLGVTLLAVNGLGDGLKALDKYQLEPTAENLKKLNDEMKSLGPAGEDFVRFLDSIEPNLKTLQNAAREGLFPGAQEGIESLMQRLPEVRKLIRDMAETMGDLSADAGAALGGERFDAFFEYLRTDGIQILDDTSRTLGNLAEAAANTFAAFGGVSTDFSGGLLKFSQGLADASANLDSNQGFQEFLHYIQTEGPHALETLGSLANAFLQIVEAAAPLGGPVLTVIGKFADILATIANSDLGTPIFAGIAALTIYNRTLQVTAGLARAAALANPVSAALVVGTAAVLTFKGAWDQAGDSIEAFQAALKASAGDIETQTALIEGMREAAAAVADDVDDDSFFEGFKNAFDPDKYVSDFRKSLGMDTGSEQMAAAADDAARALKNEREGVDTLVAPLAGLRVGMEQAAEAADEQATAINGAIQAMHDMRMEALRAANAELDYQQSIDDARKALEDNGETVDKTTDKGRANLRALYNLAGAWNGQSEVIKGNSAKLRVARQNFIDTATAMEMGEDAARKLSRQLFDIPEKRQTKVTVETAAAEAALARLAAIQFAPKIIQVKVQAHGLSSGGPLGDSPASADGGTVPKSGRGYADRYSYLLADGEEVISNRHGQADRHRSLLKTINAGRMADGGTTGGGRSVGFNLAAVDGVTYSLKQLKAALEKSEKALDREKSTREDLIAAESQFMSAVGGAYAKADLFGGGLSDFDTGLQANTADTQAAQAALAAAAAQGLDGPLYQALAQSGNLTLLQQFAGLSAGDIDIREQQFASQSNAQSALGASAADAAGFTQAIKDQTKELREAQQERRQLKLAVKSLEERLPDKVEDGARKGIAERDRRTARRVRTG